MSPATKPADTVTRFFGNCQFCEGDFKLDDSKRMVHHGYKRPGHGSIEGDCSCVGEVPYETSCERIKEYVGELRVHLSGIQEYLGKIERGEVVEFEVLNTDWRTHLVCTSYSKYVSAHFDAHLDDRRRKLEYEADSLKRDIEHRAARIKSWKKVPVRTVEEEMAKEQAEKDARRSEREAARAARNLKKAATAAKQAALRARRLEAFRAFEARVIAAAKLPPREQSAAKDAIYTERRLKKNEWMWEYHHSAEAGEALLALGMGHRGHNNVVYFS